MERDTPPEKHPLPASPVDEDIPMADADVPTPRNEPVNGRATIPLRQVQVIERRSVDTQSDAFSESYAGPRSECLQDDGPPRRATLPPSYEDTAPAPAPAVQQPLHPALTETIVELSQLDHQTPFAKKVEHLFYDSWTDQYKRPHFEAIFLFDIKSVPPRADGQAQARPTTASKDVALLSSLIELPLSFHGARRACYVGDPAYPLDFCHSTKCSICMVFRNQLALREAQVGFTLGHNIFASPSSSQADAFATNHHIRSSQHAMILCACPIIAQANTQPTIPGAPPPYSATTFTCEVVVPIGLVMYTRRGWQPL